MGRRVCVYGQDKETPSCRDVPMGHATAHVHTLYLRYILLNVAVTLVD